MEIHLFHVHDVIRTVNRIHNKVHPQSTRRLSSFTVTPTMAWGNHYLKRNSFSMLDWLWYWLSVSNVQLVRIICQAFWNTVTQCKVHQHIHYAWNCGSFLKLFIFSAGKWRMAEFSTKNTNNSCSIAAGWAIIHVGHPRWDDVTNVWTSCQPFCPNHASTSNRLFRQKSNRI